MTHSACDPFQQYFTGTWLRNRNLWDRERGRKLLDNRCLHGFENHFAGLLSEV
jgi:hypothetical protein